MRRIKNIIALPSVFIPLFSAAVLISCLWQLGYCTYLSCEQAVRELADMYDVSIQLSLKERTEVSVDSEGKKTIYNANTKMIDSSVCELLENTAELTNIRCISNELMLPLEYVCTDDDYAMISTAVERGESFDSDAAVSFYRANNNTSLLSVTGCDMSLLSEAVGYDKSTWEVILTDENATEGILLPYEMYQQLEQPNSMIIGWYSMYFSGGPAKYEKDESGYIIPQYLKEHYKELQNAEAEPKLEVKIIGCIKSDSSAFEGRAFCDINTWQKIYEAVDYYGQENNVRYYYRDGVSAADELGYEMIYADLASPALTEEVITKLIQSGIGPDDYLISSNDYSYKFALSQTQSMKRLMLAVFVAIAIFGAAVLPILSTYYVKRRQKEIYTLRTLGESNRAIRAGMVLEFGLVIMTATALGVLLSFALGDGLCSIIDSISLDRASTAMDKLSEYVSFMSDNELIREQLENAILAYSRSGIALHYRPSLKMLCVQFAVSAAAVLIVRVMTFIQTRKSLMKRGNDQ